MRLTFLAVLSFQLNEGATTTTEKVVITVRLTFDLSPTLDNIVNEHGDGLWTKLSTGDTTFFVHFEW